ncbi:MAG: hypothetical protein WD273_00795 [Trueperaceae bacterium]
MKRFIDIRSAKWLFSAIALLVLAACGDPSVVPEMHTVTVNVNGNGTVSSSVGNLDVADGSGTITVEDGDEVTLTATADAGNTFTGWSGDCTGPTSTCTFTVTEDTTVTATFAAEQVGDPELTVTVVGDGSVTSDVGGITCTAAGEETCATTLASGTEVTLTATAAVDAFTGWSGDACDGTTDLTCTFTINANTSVTATFGTPVVPEGYAIAAANDDAEELDSASSIDPTNFPAGHTYTDSSDLDLAFDPAHSTTQHVGLRFSDVAIPAGATVTSAQIVFTAAANPGSTGNVTVTIEGQNDAAPLAFNNDADTTATSDVSSRIATTASVDWNIAEAWTAGTEYSSADLTGIVQEIVDLGGWATGNEMAFIISGVDVAEYRSAESFGTDRTAPVLQVTFTGP